MKPTLLLASLLALPSLAWAADAPDDEQLDAPAQRPTAPPQYRQPYAPPPPQAYPPPAYPPQYQYDAYGRPIPQAQPQPQYNNAPPPSYPPATPQYRDAYGRPYEPAPTAQQPPPAPVALVLSTPSEAARAAAIACADALDNFHLETARAKCVEALTQDDNLAVAHLWLAQASASPDAAAGEIAKALERAGRASNGERLFIEAWRAWREARLGEARGLYDQLAQALPGEKRAFVARGQFHQVALGDVEGAIADYRRAIALDVKYAAAHNFLAFGLAEAGKSEEAVATLKKYVELAPAEPNAHDSLAVLALRAGDLNEAIAEEKKALTLDPKFFIAHATLGDALLCQGKAKEARREYAYLESSGDAALRHDGAMRSARSHLFDGSSSEAELAMVKEADHTRKARRAVEAAEAFLEVARIQIERGALAEAGRGVREAGESLLPTKVPVGGMPVVDELDRRRLGVTIYELRALALGALQERGLAEARAEEMGGQLRQLGDRHVDDRVRLVRGWIAWRVGDDVTAVLALEKAAQPTLRLAYALALSRSGETARARVIMEELARRNANDVETALSRPRATTWLKSNPGATAAATVK